MEIFTPNLLWADFDPTTEQLDSDVFSTRVDDGIIVKKLYFNGTVFPSERKTRVFAVVCRPDETYETPHKGVLVVGDYKKPIPLADLKELARKGFVVMAVDYAGRSGDGIGTIYPEEQRHLYVDRAEGLFYVGNSVKDNKIYEYVKNTRRAVTYMLSNEGVADVSLVAVNKGSYIGTIVLGTDSRIVRGTVVFGTLYRDYPLTDETHGSLEGNLSERLEEEDVARAWTMGLAPQSYLMTITAPLYVVISANSAHVDIVAASKMYYRVNDDSRLLVLPTTLDYLPQKYFDCVVAWLNGETVEEDFELTSFVDDNGDYRVKLVTAHDLDKTSVWYCVAPSRAARYWARAKLTPCDGGCTAKLNTYEKNCDIATFCLLDGQVAVSSALLDVKVRNAANVKLAGNVVFCGETGQTLIPLNSGENWWGKNIDGKLAKGYLNIVGMESVGVATFAIADPSVKRSASFTVSFDVCTDVRQKLTVSVICDYGGTNTAYTATTKLIGDGKWQRVTIETADLHRVDDFRPLGEDEHPDCLQIRAEHAVIINNILVV